MTHPQPILVRRAESADAPVVASLLDALGYAIAPLWAREVLAHAETVVLLAFSSDGDALGLLALSHRPQLRLGGLIASIDELVVMPEARGEGVGGLLLAAAIELARTLGAVRVELHTRRARESYRRGFYVKHGFTEADSALMRMDLAARDLNPRLDR